MIKLREALLVILPLVGMLGGCAFLMEASSPLRMRQTEIVFRFTDASTGAPIEGYPVVFGDYHCRSIDQCFVPSFDSSYIEKGDTIAPMAATFRPRTVEYSDGEGVIRHVDFHKKEPSVFFWIFLSDRGV